MSDIFKSLNPKQQEAVKIVDSPSIILAGAGSGKTRVLIHKVLNLVQNEGVDASSIVMITFTNKAAREMKERIQQATNDNTVLGYVGTFHSFCCRILRRDGIHIGLPHNFNIYDENDKNQLLKHILNKRDIKKYTPSYFGNRISDAKNQLIAPDKYLSIYSFYKAATVADIYDEYQKELKKNQAVDFDDLIMSAVTLFQKHPDILEKYQKRYQYLLVDEFQDTNVAQYVLTQKLAKTNNNITVVGDFSQSIYSWRGADIRNLEKFSQDFPDAKVIHLEQNYRSTQNILDFAYEVISENQMHPILHLHTENDQGEEIAYYESENEEAEALYVVDTIQELVNEDEYSEIAVLYRTNAQSRVIEEVFLHYGIPYTLIGGIRFYERKEIKDILSYLRLFIHPTDLVSTERVKKLGKTRWQRFKELYLEVKDKVDEIHTIDLMEMIFSKTGYLDKFDVDNPEDYARLENIKELKSVALSFPNLVEFLEQVALVESEYFEGEPSPSRQGGTSTNRRKEMKNSVKLMTLHQAKGLEFDYVFIVGLEEGLLPHSRSIDDTFQLEEERRLFYVGITRARKKLYLTYARRRFIFGRRNASIKSRFIQKEDETEDDDWW